MTVPLPVCLKWSPVRLWPEPNTSSGSTSSPTLPHTAPINSRILRPKFGALLVQTHIELTKIYIYIMKWFVTRVNHGYKVRHCFAYMFMKYPSYTTKQVWHTCCCSLLNWTQSGTDWSWRTDWPGIIYDLLYFINCINQKLTRKCTFFHYSYIAHNMLSIR